MRSAGTGARPGNHNARKHGLYGAERKARRRRITDFVRAGNRMLWRIDETD